MQVHFYLVNLLFRLIFLSNTSCTLSGLLLRAQKHPFQQFLFHIIFVGDGDYRAQLESDAENLRIEKYCKFAGIREDVPQILADSDIFVHSCIWEEGFGIGIVEAMAAGKVCICSNSGAIPEIITDGVNGYLSEKGNSKALAEAIMTVVDNKDNWENIQIRARTTAYKFNMMNFVSRLDKVVEDIMDER